MRSLVVVVFFVSSFNVFSQSIIDTIPTDRGPMLLYSNRTWAYVEDLNFDGILNPVLHEKIFSDTSITKYIHNWEWNNDECFTSDKKNNLALMKDTIWLCLTDSVHSEFHIPFNGSVTSGFGHRWGREHYGVDIDLHTGDTVRAAFSGKVRYSKYNGGGYGNLVIIRHYNGLETFYAHLKQCIVVPNQYVEAGDPIGIGGSTGHSTGSHLHFEVRFLDMPINPNEIINFKKYRLKKCNLLVRSGLFDPRAGSPNASGDYVSATKTYHRIRSGETLSYLARRYRTSVSRICSLNNIRPTTILRIGRSLRVR